MSNEKFFDDEMTNYDKVYCPIFGREVDDGYCWELCNIATDEILLYGDKVADWDEAQEICKKCGRYED